MDARGDALTLFNITQTAAANAQTVESDDRFAGHAFGNFTDMSQGPIEADTLGSFDGQVAVDDAGDAAAVWSYQADPAGNPNAHTIRLRTRPAGGDWAAPIDVSAPGAPAGEDARFPSLAVDGHGTPTVAWQDTQAFGDLRAVTRSGSSVPTMPQLLTSPGEMGADPDAAANARGDRAVAWRDRSTSNDQLIAVNTAAAGASAFSVRRTLSNSSAANVVSAPADAVNATGTATVVWGEGTTTGPISAADVPLSGNPSPTVIVSGSDQAQTSQAAGVRDGREG